MHSQAYLSLLIIPYIGIVSANIINRDTNETNSPANSAILAFPTVPNPAQAWSKRLVAGENLTVTVVFNSVFEWADTWNVITETKYGDPDSVILLGAHLDNVPAGPGINNNGSGSAALLEIINALAGFEDFPNKIRFAFWAAEEIWMIGSLHYINNLTKQEFGRIKFYFNYDMLGSPNPRFEINRDDISGRGATELFSYLATAGMPAQYAWVGLSFVS